MNAKKHLKKVLIELDYVNEIDLIVVLADLKDYLIQGKENYHFNKNSSGNRLECSFKQYYVTQRDSSEKRINDTFVEIVKSKV